MKKSQVKGEINQKFKDNWALVNFLFNKKNLVETVKNFEVARR